MLQMNLYVRGDDKRIRVRREGKRNRFVESVGYGKHIEHGIQDELHIQLDIQPVNERELQAERKYDGNENIHA